ncbi:hypothetical protein D3C78_1944360 [compost metagenome]
MDDAGFGNLHVTLDVTCGSPLPLFHKLQRAGILLAANHNHFIRPPLLGVDARQAIGQLLRTFVRRDYHS